MQGQINIKDLAKNSIFHSSGIFIGKAFNFALKIISLKILGLELLGIYVFLNLIIQYYSYLFFGISYALPRIIPTLQAKKNYSEIAKFRSVTNIFHLFVHSILFIFFIIFTKYFHSEDVYGFSKLNLCLVFLTAFFSQVATLINSHLKSIGEFTKKTVNSALVRVFFPILSITLIYFYELEGYFAAGLIINAINAINLISFCISKNLNIFNINYFSLRILRDNMMLGISMLVSKKYTDILFTIFMTFLGFNFSKAIVGEVGFLTSIFNSLSQLIGPYFLVAERRLYLLKEMAGLRSNDLVNLSFGNTMIFGLLMNFFSLSMFFLIPIFFNELEKSLMIIPLLAIMFSIKNSILINEFYINAFEKFFNRNFIALLVLIIFTYVLNFEISGAQVNYFLLAYMIALSIYKIFMQIQSLSFFKTKANIIKTVLGDFLSVFLIFSLPYFMIQNDLNLFSSIVLFCLLMILTTLVYLENPKSLLKRLYNFLNRDLSYKK